MEMNGRKAVSRSSSVRVSKKERGSVLQEYWMKPTPHELDIIDKGDHLEVQSCSGDAAAWWMGTLRAMYPQDPYGTGSKTSLTMHPDHGVKLKLNTGDGTLKIKGKNHLQWFKENFDQVLETGGKECAALAELSKNINKCLTLEDLPVVDELLECLPPTGAIKHGPSFIYRLWKGLLNKWMEKEGDIFVISPLLDSKRLADMILLSIKHRLSRSQITVQTMMRCDGEIKFPKIFKSARDMIRDIKLPTKKRLIADERLQVALQKFEFRFSVFHCRMIACVGEDYTEVLTTSASFHKWHFEQDHTDSVMYFKLPNEDFLENYLKPLGLATELRIHREDSQISSPDSNDFGRRNVGIAHRMDLTRQDSLRSEESNGRHRIESQNSVLSEDAREHSYSEAAEALLHHNAMENPMSQYLVTGHHAASHDGYYTIASPQQERSYCSLSSHHRQQTEDAYYASLDHRKLSSESRSFYRNAHHEEPSPSNQTYMATHPVDQDLPPPPPAEVNCM